MKLYIIITDDIHGIGGMQTYTWGKTEYLKRHGWDVAVFFPGDNTGDSPYCFLNQYIRGGIPILAFEPSDLSKRTINHVLEQMRKAYNLNIEKYDNLIVESHYDLVSLWGELVAKQFHGKHMCYCCSEYFDEPRHYRRHLDFYKFKYDRQELYGITKSSIGILFNGVYKDIPTEEKYVFTAYYPQNVVQDIQNEKLNNLAKADWKIVYFGRSRKRYFDVVIKEVAEFSKEFSNKKIQFIIIGNEKDKKPFIDMTFQELSNVEVIAMGEIAPVPRIAFTLADVVIAGSGCAVWSYKNGAYTIVADGKDGVLANGLLGYDTFNSINAEDKKTQKSFHYYLKQVLVEKSYNTKKRTELFMKSNAVDPDIDNRYDEHEQLINRSTDKIDYYDTYQIDNGIHTIIEHIKKMIRTPLIYSVYLKICSIIRRL